MSAPAAEHFVIDTHRDGSTEVVVVRGEVDTATAPLLRAVLDTVVGRRPGRLEVDLSGASYLGAHALTALTETRSRLAARRVRLVLRDPSPAARRLLVRTDLALDIVDGDGADAPAYGSGRQLFLS
ncbi:MAG TPA: STAS domain-containing protein [Mycobacteriales bacterium]|nr:STAS domain-containing protein [Mycobacteriales bacterium]